MDPYHSLPTMDISPLRHQGLAKLGLELPAVLELAKEALAVDDIEWKLSKFAHREHGEQRDIKFDPSGIVARQEAGELDYRLIVRQEQSALKQESWFGPCGDLNENKSDLVSYIYDALGDNAKYFGNVFFLKMNSDQGFLPHKDGGGTSRLYIPITPHGEEYSRLEFYHNNQIYYVYNYEPTPPVYLFSSRVIHAVYNYGYPRRINLQINCKLSYSEALALFDES
tara:strand:- start:1860 stop:2534 length:675 start_codon:yes stop_codon:yes gene_type:complete